jgi:hypothetical protein
MVTDKTDGASGLGGREIDPYHLDTQITESWISVCSQRHRKTCWPVWTEQLSEIRLVDVRTRTVVKYPGNDCSYIALSYVWGGVKQERFQLGSELKSIRLPQTIEDAITLTVRLRKQYLWVDSICIDQTNDADKADQIGRMWSIYRGAYITIIALSGKSANSGLPRVGPHVPNQPQLHCSINGKRLVGLMPTLSQQIWQAPWGKRAWTLQEALLSPRCLYVSDHQLYYECNEMQCNESLDETDSWAHKLGHNSGPAVSGWLQAQTGAGCLKNPVDDPADRISHYGAKVTLYSYRSMTNPADGLNAFRGILQRLTTLYKEGFHYGLPIADFSWGLLWRSRGPPKRRHGFPTWSWAGWEVSVWPAYPSNHYQPHQFPVPLCVWKVVSKQLMPIFHTPYSLVGPAKESLSGFKNDPLNQISTLTPEDSEFNILNYDEPEENGYLFIEAITLNVTPDYSHPLTTASVVGQNARFQFVGGTLCELCIMSTDEQLQDLPKRTKQHFLLLARDRGPGGVIHYLMLLEYDDDLQLQEGERWAEAVAERKTVMEVIVPEGRLDVLNELGMKMRRTVLR